MVKVVRFLTKIRIDTKNILAEKADVSHDTVAKVKKILKSNPDPQKLLELRQGKIKINNEYTKLVGKKSKSEFVPTCLFDESGNLIPDLSTIKSFTIRPLKDGKFRIEAVSVDNQRKVYETNNLIKVTEVKPLSTLSDEQPILTKPNPVPVRTITTSINSNTLETAETSTIIPSDNAQLHLLYEEYDFSTISNPLWEDLRTMFIQDVRKMNNYISLTMNDKCEFPKFCEKLRLELLNNWEKKNQPLGGSRKSPSKIIENLKKFKNLELQVNPYIR